MPKSTLIPKAHIPRFSPFITVLTCMVFSCTGPEFPREIHTELSQIPSSLDFNIHVKPILSDKCYACHGPDQGKRKTGLRLDQAEAVYAELPETPGKKAIAPGNLEKSEVFHRIMSADPDVHMPPPEFKVDLSTREKAILIQWIEEGAHYKPHWAFIKPTKPELPNVQNRSFVQNPIDFFVLRNLEGMKISPKPEASKEVLLRRLSLDLTGLPPSIKEIESFLGDNSAGAYEKQVDRLLSSVHYGEKMATDWMDVARYSDTYGYQVDRYRDMSPWRDWVIRAFNKNMPYDRFLVWQLAGDLLPNASKEQILATGFNRLHPLNMEDGIIDEEFRVENVSDRVAVLGDGIMGLTLSCAKCHDHKYDPLSQREYYELYSYFNTINETGQISWDKAVPVPTLQLPTQAQLKAQALLHKKIAHQKTLLGEISEREKVAIANWIENGDYQSSMKGLPMKGLIAHYPLDRQLNNIRAPKQSPKMERVSSKQELPTFVDGYKGQALQLDGDAWLNCQEVGIFKRSDPFSVGLWIYFPEELKEGVIFHKNKGSTLHAFRGYHLYLNNNRLEWVMARTWPENAIIEHSVVEVPKEQWLHLMLSYDGSSTAKGTRIFLNGKEMETIIVKDKLTRDIVFNYLEDIIYPEPIEPNLKVGARWRGVGIKQAKVDDILVYDRALTSLEVAQIVGNGALPLSFKHRKQLSQVQKKQLQDYYLANFSSDYHTALDRTKALRTALVDSMEQVQEIMVMQEMPSPRKTHVLERGVYDALGVEVFPNTPRHLMSMPNDFPKNRLGLAKWLVHPDHPLTARVAVNRYWQMFFGNGLVTTPQDFGNQGALPSHPELLDWLATQFIESGWDLKALHKLIVMSAVYRQGSKAEEGLLERDPDNMWLARGPNIRLTSEMIRDNALAASGLLNRKVGGESVYPYQPEGLWAMNFDPYPQDSGEKLYRRSLYTMWRRTNPNPTLATFDQPERNVCTVRRQKTNTPLQALVLLNDPTFVEAAKVMGEKMALHKDIKEGIAIAFQQLTGKKPLQSELDLLLELQEKEHAFFQSNPQKSQGWLAMGNYIIDSSLDANLVAANAVVASVILNGDATLTKR